MITKEEFKDLVRKLSETERYFGSLEGASYSWTDDMVKNKRSLAFMRPLIEARQKVNAAIDELFEGRT